MENVVVVSSNKHVALIQVLCYICGVYVCVSECEENNKC